jgi:uncharacterized protein (DUF433 family)
VGTGVDRPFAAPKGRRGIVHFVILRKTRFGEEAMEPFDGRITIDPDVCHGKPTIRGLRYPVQTILELMAGGMSEREILADYPDLESADLRAVLAYAARLAQVKRIERLDG